MRIASKAKPENWGMGFLLVLFPEDEPPPLPSTITPLSRTPSDSILTKAQSTISICFILFLLSLLLLGLSPLPTNHLGPRRQHPGEVTVLPSHALQGMGVLHRRGTRGMQDLVVGHVTESLAPEDLRLFIRLFHVSGIASHSDLVLIFPVKLNGFESVISGEIEFFSKLNSTRIVKLSKKDKELGEPIWGKKNRSSYSENESTRLSESAQGSDRSFLVEERIRRNYTANESTGSAGSTTVSYGSVVSFVADELDPENSLAGFLDHVGMNLRRWACYSMLLGRVRRNFKHIVLADAREVFLFGDPLARVRTRSPEWVQLTTDATVASKHGTELVTRKRVNSGLIMGGARGVRRLGNAMLTEIVRAATATQHKRKNSVTESAILNQFAGNEHVLKSANVNVFTESVPDVSSLSRISSSSGSGSPLGSVNFTAVRRGNSNLDVNSVIRKHICSLLHVNYSIYSEC